MMILPQTYVNDLRDKSYSQLLKERDYLIRNMRRFEKGKHRDDEITHPSPEIRYKFSFLYLAKLCELIEEKYTQEKNEVTCDCN